MAEQACAVLEEERERNLALVCSLVQAEASVAALQQHLMAIGEELEEAVGKSKQ